MTDLTQDRIKAAIDWVEEEKIVTNVQRHLKATRVHEVNKIVTADVLDTILAALDAVRWRDMATEPPTYDERCRILVIFKGERGEGKPVMLTYDPEEDPYFNKFEDSHFVNTRYSPTDGEESYGLPVWQNNIDKWRPVVW